MDTFAQVCGIDVETLSAHDIKHGAWGYSIHESTDIYCMVFALADRAAPKGHSYDYVRWQPGDAPPRVICDFIEAGGLMLAHNNAFEKSIWENIAVKVYGFPPIDPTQWRDTQAIGMALNLPQALGGLAKSLGCPIQKNDAGHKLMMKMCVATPDPAGGWDSSHNTPANRQTLADYCADDVGATLDCYFRMESLTVTEFLIWSADQRINERGVYLDREFAAKCARVATKRKHDLSNETFQITGGALENSTATPSLKKWLVEKGVELPTKARLQSDGSMKSTPTTDRPAILKILEDPELDPEIRAVLSNRIEANKATSLKKLDRVPLMTGADGRLRHSLMYCGAGTGRWTSYGLQIHNLPKDKMEPGESGLVRLALEAEDLELLILASENPLGAISQSLRSVLSAPPGRELIAGDYSSIEARVIAWLAGQNDMLTQLRRYDAAKAQGRKVQDLYEYTAAGIGSSSRQLGKVCVLALGYGMGAVTFISTAAGYGIPLAPKDARKIQRAWRETNPMIVTFWKELEDAAKAAISDLDVRWRVGRISLYADKQCLHVVLPSGRHIRYWRPKVRMATRKIQVIDDDGRVQSKEIETEEIRYFTQSRDKRDMMSESTYGGKLAENVTQAIARDLLGEALLRFERTDPYEVVAHVHDSIASEVPAGSGSVEEFCYLMSELPTWADGLPLAVDGYRDRRFRG